MTQYYWEKDDDCGSFWASNDAIAIQMATDMHGLLILYKESETENGFPFITLWEQSWTIKN
jgi:hypothetical protein